jgi:preprotein translocase subunit SecD
MRRGLVWSLVFIVVLAAGALGATIGVGHSPLLGLDLKGGVAVVLRPQVAAGKSQLNEAVTIIERRVNGLGVSNSDVAVQGQDVVINLPGIKNSQQALAELGTTAQLLFRPVYCPIPAYTPPSSTSSTTAPSSSTTAPKASPTTSKGAAGAGPSTAKLTSAAVVAAGSTTPTTAAPATSTPATPAPTAAAPTPAVTQTDCSNSNVAQLPTTPVSQDNATATVVLPVDAKAFPQSPTIRYILGPADLTGTEVSNASAQVDPTTGQYSVQLTLNSKGAAQFDNIAAARYAAYKTDPNNPPPQSEEAFELDGTVESAPTFQAASFAGNVSITGNFTSAQASNLANQLKYGSLPVRFVPQSVQTISATIGKDSLRAGLLAGIGGLLVVMIYMIAYYRALGLVVLAGLGIGGAILYSILSELSQTSSLTLTLAGVTGIIVSIGITVDSYVVYFERLKDEVRGGRSVRQSVERGFTRAFKTVLTADLVSFLAALILYILTIGDVRGFAFTLGLSTLLDVFTAYFFIRPAVILVGRRRSLTDNRFLGISRGLGIRAAPREA